MFKKLKRVFPFSFSSEFEFFFYFFIVKFINLQPLVIVFYIKWLIIIKKNQNIFTFSKRKNQVFKILKKQKTKEKTKRTISK